METKKINGKAVASLILSCFSVLCCVTWYFAIILGMVGIVLGILAYRESAAGQRDLAIAGIIVGAVGMSLGIVSAVLYILLTSGSADSLQQTSPVSPSAIGVPSVTPSPDELPDDGSGSVMFAVRRLRMWF